MKKQLLFTGLATLTVLSAFSQNMYVKQYFVTTGGDYSADDNKVAVSVIKNSKLEAIDSVAGNFSNFTEIYQDKLNNRQVGIAHIGRKPGQKPDVVVRYDLDSYEKIDTFNTNGAQAVAVNGTHLLVAKGVGLQGASLDIYNTASLQFVKGVTGLYPAADVKILGDSAYIAHSMKSVVNLSPGSPLGYYLDSIGYISILSLRTNTVVQTIELGKSGAGVNGLHIYKGEDSRTHIIYNNTTNRGTIEAGNIVLHASGNTQVIETDSDHIFGIQPTGPLLTTVVIQRSTADTTIATGYKKGGDWDNRTFAYDTVNHEFLVLQTDYATFGKLIRFKAETGDRIDSVATGISSTAFSIDYRQGFPTSLNTETHATLRVKPNPFRDKLTVVTNNQAFTNWTLTSAEGREMASGILSAAEETISTDHLLAGMYVLTLKGQHTQSTLKVIKH